MTKEYDRPNAAVITIFNLPNYGSVLQAFATQEIIKHCGFNCTIINYDNIYSDWHNKHTKSRPSWKYRYLGFLGLTKNHRKYKHLQRFYKNNLHLTKRFLSENKLKAEDWSKYDVFISGSDQIWNPRFTFADPVFMLSFVPERKRRIAISSSFSCDKLDNKVLPQFKENLLKYDAISVREQNGLNILNSQIEFKGDTTITLDPTLLFSSEEWISLDSMQYEKHKGKYILVYMLDYAFDPKPCIFDVIHKYEKILGINAICLEGNFNRSTKRELKITDKTDSSIGDFISLFKNAALVVTSSFHGTAFALNFGTPLVSIIPPGGKDDRQSTIIKKLGLERCLCKNTLDIANLNPFYDKEIEQSKLAHLRNESINWIKSHIKA